MSSTKEEILKRIMANKPCSPNCGTRTNEYAPKQMCFVCEAIKNSPFWKDNFGKVPLVDIVNEIQQWEQEFDDDDEDDD